MFSSVKYAFIFLAFNIVSCRTVSPRAVTELRNDPTGEKAKLMDTVAKLIDLYVFPSPSKPGSVVLALNVPVLSPEQAVFSDRVNYIFYLRDLKSERDGQNVRLRPRGLGERVIMCWFQTPKESSKHRGSCSLPRIGEVASGLGEVTATDKASFFHGPRLDPYFADTELIKKVLGQQKLVQVSYKESQQTSVMSLVLEFKVDEIFGRDVGMVGVLAQSYTTSNNGQQKALDRLGRPGLDLFFGRDSGNGTEISARFKAERPFEITEANRMAYNERVFEQLGKIDGVDLAVDWDASGKASLTDLLVNDYIIFDSKKWSNGSRFFGIEEEILSGKKSISFGGRSFLEDSFGRYFNFMVSRKLSSAHALSAKKKLDMNFPYLQKPRLFQQNAGIVEMSRPTVSFDHVK